MAEREKENTQAVTSSHCPLLDNPQPYLPFLMAIRGKEVTVIPAESIDSIPTSFTQNCIEQGASEIPYTFACAICRRYGAIGK